VPEGRTYKESAKALHITPTTARNRTAAIHANASSITNAELDAKLLELD